MRDSTSPVTFKKIEGKEKTKLKIKLSIMLAVIGLLFSGVTVYGAGRTVQHEKAFAFFSAQGVEADGSVIRGSSGTLIRSDDDVSIEVNTTGLPPGAYTNWWVIFNE